MTINERAAAMRQAWLGDAAGEAVAWNELKQCVRDRWLAVLDAAQPESTPVWVRFDVTAEEFAEKMSPIVGANVDIEIAANVLDLAAVHAVIDAPPGVPSVPVYGGWHFEDGYKIVTNGQPSSNAGQFDADEVEALLPGVPEDDALAELEVVKAERDEYLRMYENEQKNADHWKAKAALADAAVAELRDQIDDDNTNAAAVNDLLIKLQNVTAERDRLVDENKQVTIDYGIAVKSHNRQQEAHVACKNEVDRLVSQLAAVTAERDDARAELAASEIELADKAFYVREFAAVSAERDGLKKRNDVQAEQLIRIDSEISPLMSEVAELKAERDAARAELAACMERAEQAGVQAAPPPLSDEIIERMAKAHMGVISPSANWEHTDKQYYMNAIRAAIAHLRKRPEGLPTAEELKQVYRDGWNEGAGGDTCASGITAILAALAPWLREPVGWELDVTAEDALRVYARNQGPAKSILGMQAVLDLCRSRIHPTYECKECADKERRVQEMADIGNDFACKYELQRDRADGLAAKIASFARAALEGE